MKEMIVTVGCSGSGKTTWAEEYVRENYPNWTNVNRDDERFALTNNGVRDWTKYKFNKSNERKVTEIVDAKLAQALLTGQNIIVSDTNLNPKFRAKFKELAQEHGYKYSEREFVVPWIELEKRNVNRQGGVSMTVLRSQYLRMEEYLGRKRYEADESKQPAVIIDIDGTIADMTGIRKPFEWNKVYNDRPRTPIIEMVVGLINAGYKPIFLSGRDGECSELTQDWIIEHVYKCSSYTGPIEYEFLMRTAGDSRKDFIIKEELFWQVADKYNITTAIDDRPQVLRLWEELGIKNIVSVGGSLYNEF